MIYSAEFLKDIYKTIRLNDAEEQNQFKQFVNTLGEGYLWLKQLHSKNPHVAKQKRLLKQYYNSIEKTRSLYDKIKKDRVCESVLSVALRTQFKNLSPNQKNEISAYINETGFHEPLFAHALELHLKASELATHKHLSGKDEKEVLMQWLEACRDHWPKKAKIKFAVGSYDTQLHDYLSPSRDALYQLIHLIDPIIKKTYITSLMRELL
jgi:hypothetical protein